MITFEELKQQVLELSQVSGITPVDVLDLPESLQPAFKKMLKRHVSLQDLASELQLAESQTRLIGNLLVDKGYLQDEELPDGGIRYRVRFARMRTHHLPVEF